MKNLTHLLNSKLYSLSVPSIVDVELDIHPGNGNQMLLYCDEKYFSQVKVTFSDGALVVSAQGEFRNAGETKLKVTADNLEKIKISGTADVTGACDTKNLEITSSGTGDVSLRGQVHSLNLKLSGTGEARLKELKCSDVKIVSSGTGDAKISASDSVDVKASGTGDVKVYGTPAQVQQKASGLSNIKFMDKKVAKKDDEFGIGNIGSLLNTEMFTSMGGMFDDTMARMNKMQTEMQMQAQKLKMEAEMKIKEMNFSLEKNGIQKNSPEKNGIQNNLPEIKDTPEPTKEEKLSKKIKGML